VYQTPAETDLGGDEGIRTVSGCGEIGAVGPAWG